MARASGIDSSRGGDEVAVTRAPKYHPIDDGTGSEQAADCSPAAGKLQAQSFEVQAPSQSSVPKMRKFLSPGCGKIC